MGCQTATVLVSIAVKAASLVSDLPFLLVEGLDKTPQSVLSANKNYCAVLASESVVRAVQPNFSLLEQLHPYGVVVTAPGDEVDFVSRYFARSYGAPEDPVTGSTH
ncbi:MAG: PhzF family phenazine biosynthesis protein [Cyanophyceae cyanobacterium]